MLIGVLEAGTIPPAMQPEPRYAQPFIDLLSPVDPKLRFRPYAAHDGELPETPEACDGYIVTGSPAGVHDDLEWIAPLGEFVVAARASGAKLVGVCFGHQLLADAFGGEVVKLEKGHGIGVHDYHVTGLRPWMDPPQARVASIVFHRDQVTRPPPGAQVLAGSAFCPNAIFQLGEQVLGVQPHPEIEPPFATKLLNLRRDEYGEAATEAALASLARRRDSALLARWIVNFLAA